VFITTNVNYTSFNTQVLDRYNVFITTNVNYTSFNTRTFGM